MTTAVDVATGCIDDMAGVSSFPRAASVLWLPLSGAIAGTAFSCYHSYKLVYLMTWYMAQLDGADWTKPRTSQVHAKAVGAATAIIGGSLIFGGFKAVLDRILMSPLRPSVPGRLETVRGGFGSHGSGGSEQAILQRPRLTLRRFVTLLGPRATTHTVSEFTRVHGAQAASMFLAAMWAVMLTPILQARAEAACVMWGPPKSKEDRDRALQDLRTVMKRAEMRGTLAPTPTQVASSVAVAPGTTVVVNPAQETVAGSDAAPPK